MSWCVGLGCVNPDCRQASAGREERKVSRGGYNVNEFVKSGMKISSQMIVCILQFLFASSACIPLCFSAVKKSGYALGAFARTVNNEQC
jgi:hypothetical protein